MMKFLNSCVPANVILVVVLFSLGACNQKQTTPLPSASSLPTAAGGKIVFVQFDTLLSKYQLTIDQKDSLEKEASKAEKSFAAKAEAFQKRAMKFQREVYEIQQKAQNIAPVELKALEGKFKSQEAQLAKEEQALATERDKANNELNTRLANVDKDLITKINAYLEKLAAEKGYDFILMKGGGGGVLYGNKGLDVTLPIVDALNAEYKASKK